MEEDTIPVVCVMINLPEGSMANIIYILNLHVLGGSKARWRSWLRHCATSQKVAGLIPDCVIEIFH